jgi:hypothetical protein
MYWMIGCLVSAFLWAIWVLLWVRARGMLALEIERKRAASDLDEKERADRLEQVRHLESMVDSFARRASAEKKRADDQFKVIEDATRETAVIWKLYRKQSIEAGNAQAWLFRELGNIQAAFNRQAKAHNFPAYTIPERLQNVISTYSEDHMDEANALKNKDMLLKEQLSAEAAVLRDRP